MRTEKEDNCHIHVNFSVLSPQYFSLTDYGFTS